jgi:hypothetical protein
MRLCSLTTRLVLLALLTHSGTSAAATKAQRLQQQATHWRRTGLSLVVLGSLNLALTLGMGIGGSIACANAEASGGRCELFAAVVIGTSTAGAIVGSALLSTGIPILIRGNHDLERARDPERMAREEIQARERERDPVWLARQRVLGHRLLRAGGVTVSLALAASTLWLWAYSKPGTFPRDFTPVMEATSLVTMALSIGLFTSGGVYLRRGSRGAPPTRLELRVGSAVTLSGTF